MTIHYNQLRGSIPLDKLATDPLARANHTGSQAASTISDFNDSVDARITAAGIDTSLLDNKNPARIRMSMNESTFDAGGFSTSQQSLTVVNNDRIFVEVTDSRDKSGIYVATVTGGTFELARSSDANSSAEVTYGMTVAILEGTQSGYRYVLTAAGTITLDTTDLTFTEFAPITALAGDGTTIQISGLTISIPNGGVGTSQLADVSVTDAKLLIVPIIETPSGTIDGSNASFTLAHTPESGTLILQRNGVTAKLTTEYTLSGGTITFEAGFEPQTGDWLLTSYRYNQD